MPIVFQQEGNDLIHMQNYSRNLIRGLAGSVWLLHIVLISMLPIFKSFFIQALNMHLYLPKTCFKEPFKYCKEAVFVKKNW
jgi:hypothetical protein